jgi:hypothetical protein
MESQKGIPVLPAFDEFVTYLGTFIESVVTHVTSSQRLPVSETLFGLITLACEQCESRETHVCGSHELVVSLSSEAAPMAWERVITRALPGDRVTLLSPGSIGGEAVGPEVQEQRHATIVIPWTLLLQLWGESTEIQAPPTVQSVFGRDMVEVSVITGLVAVPSIKSKAYPNRTP